MVNKVILLGNLGADPEMVYPERGGEICKFRLATGGEKDQATEWHNIVCFKKVAESCGRYLKKGSQVYLEGKTQTRKFEDKEGNRRTTTEVVAWFVKFLKGVGEDRKAESQPAGDDDVPW